MPPTGYPGGTVRLPSGLCSDSAAGILEVQ